MKKLNYGYISIALFIIALAVGIIAIGIIDVGASALYALYVALYFPAIAYVFCRKCPHAINDTCKHFFIGRLTKFMPLADNRPLKKINIIILMILSIILIVIPQFWLLANLYLMTIFWGVTTIALVMILTKVCRSCGNVNCPNCPNRA